MMPLKCQGRVTYVKLHGIKRRQRLRQPSGIEHRPPRQARVASSGAQNSQQQRDSVSSAPANFLDQSGGKFRRRALLWWPNGTPRSVLIVKKRNCVHASQMLQRIAEWLKDNGLKVFVEERVQKEEFPQFYAWTSKLEIPDFCVTLGGDGTVLHTASLFRQESALPPVTAFAMGTLGFLTPFEASNFEPLLSRVVRANEQAVFCTLRTRLVAEVFTAGQCVATHHAFNEVCIDRGPNMTFLQLEAYIDGSYVTTIQGDGLIVATPSGSTAYSMSAGGPMVAPSVPCVLLTPIAPHSLSFRPVVVAESSDIVIHVPEDLSDHARVSFDGKNVTALAPGSSVRLSIARWPLPMITGETRDLDWFVSITEKLMWNAVIKKDQRKGLPDTLPTAAALDVLNRSTDECSLDVAGCVILPPPAPVGAPQGVRPAAGHHTGQALKDIDDSMPIYCPNPSDPADCLTVWNGSLSGSSSSTDEGQGPSTPSPPKNSQS